VSDALRALGAAPAAEVMTADGMFCVDIAVTWRGRWEGLVPPGRGFGQPAG
jgi:hypothetical protein